MISKRDIEVRYNETDQMGVVYHGNYVVWCELGRTKFLRDLGFEYLHLEERNLLFPIRNVNIDYLKPCKYGEKISVYTQVHEFSSIKTTYYHEIKNDQGDLKAAGYTTVVCVQKDSFRLTKIEKYAKDVYDAYKNLPTLKK